MNLPQTHPKLSLGNGSDFGKKGGGIVLFLFFNVCCEYICLVCVIVHVCAHCHALGSTCMRICVCMHACMHAYIGK